jgi:hypothetical protein
MVAVTPVRLGEPCGRLLRLAFGVRSLALGVVWAPSCDERQTPNAKRQT